MLYFVAAYIVAVYHSMREEMRRNAPGSTPIKRRQNSQVSQEAGETGALPGESTLNRRFALFISCTFIIQ